MSYFVATPCEIVHDLNDDYLLHAQVHVLFAGR